MYEHCKICGKPLVNNGNLKKLRVIITSSGLGILALGGAAFACLPALIGFGAGGIVSGSLAASWQSSIGAVAAGSLFATLQSLGATGAASLLFGSMGSVASGSGALYLLHTIASKLKCMYEHCKICGKPLVNNGNLKKLRVIITSSGLGILALGGAACAFLPALIGLGAGGIASGSMGAVAAGSFATLQSLGAAGVASLLFGSMGSVASGSGALYLLHTKASKLKWCEC